MLGRHGVLEHERSAPQPFVLDVGLELDLGSAAATDDLGATVHYGEVAELVVAETAASHFALLERLAGHLAGALLDRFAPLAAVTVTVHKPRAPVAADVADVAVTLRRSRS